MISSSRESWDNFFQIQGLTLQVLLYLEFELAYVNFEVKFNDLSQGFLRSRK